MILFCSNDDVLTDPLSVCDIVYHAGVVGVGVSVSYCLPCRSGRSVCIIHWPDGPQGYSQIDF